MDRFDSEQPLWRLDLQFKDPIRRRLFPIVKAPLGKALLLDRINRLYRQIEKKGGPLRFLTAVKKILNIHYRITERDLERIPPKGPVIVVMNHPFGGTEGIILASLLHSRRSDLKIMANWLLGGIPELKDLFILVDPFQQRDSVGRNIKALRETIRWLQEGGMLGVFPAGEVAHFHFKQRKIIDPPWSQTIARMVRKTGASALPVFIRGSNGPLFQIAGLVHPSLRTALLPRELLNKQKKEIEIRVGRLIPHKNLTAFNSDREMMDYLRQRTYMLEHRPPDPEKNREESPKPTKKEKRLKPIISSTVKSFLVEEIRNLPMEQILIVQNEYKAAFAYAPQIPYLLREIGRLREVTFRQAGEGTGKALDLDEYDTFYLHLFLWKEDTQELIGAYRLGATDRLLNRSGRKNLYTQTLFSCHHSFFKRIDPALELGRSFVRAEFQKSYAPLLLLWKGIGQYVARHPRYKILFGPVSINREYQAHSRELMVTFLRDRNYLPDLAKWIKPKNPFRPRPEDWMIKASRLILKNIEEVSTWVAELEPDQKGVPILLKQYLKLGGKLLGFNIDPQFSHVLDGLILVDLTRTDDRALERYMGKEGLGIFREYHNREPFESGWEMDPPRRAA
jgi:putative hemolysin